jgi:hypothetical protein
MRFSNCLSLLAATVVAIVSAELYDTAALSGPAPISGIHARAAQLFNRQNYQDCGSQFSSLLQALILSLLYMY